MFTTCKEPMLSILTRTVSFYAPVVGDNYDYYFCLRRVLLLRSYTLPKVTKLEKRDVRVRAWACLTWVPLTF